MDQRSLVITMVTALVVLVIINVLDLISNNVCEVIVSGDKVHVRNCPVDENFWDFVKNTKPHEHLGLYV
uniref:Movement protein TGBp3 n=1 Tax=Saffron betaflexivirus 1 TaxID=3119434 RepID=A0AAU6MW62_9VIRU